MRKGCPHLLNDLLQFPVLSLQLPGFLLVIVVGGRACLQGVLLLRLPLAAGDEAPHLDRNRTRGNQYSTKSGQGVQQADWWMHIEKSWKIFLASSTLPVKIFKFLYRSDASYLFIFSYFGGIFSDYCNAFPVLHSREQTIKRVVTTRTFFLGRSVNDVSMGCTLSSVFYSTHLHSFSTYSKQVAMAAAKYVKCLLICAKGFFFQAPTVLGRW